MEEETDLKRTLNSVRIVNILLGLTNIDLVIESYIPDSLLEIAYLVILIGTSALSLASTVFIYLQIYKSDRMRVVDIVYNLIAFFISLAGVSGFIYAVHMEKNSTYAYDQRIIACIFGTFHASLFAVIMLGQSALGK